MFILIVFPLLTCAVSALDLFFSNFYSFFFLRVPISKSKSAYWEKSKTKNEGMKESNPRIILIIGRYIYLQLAAFDDQSPFYSFFFEVNPV